MRAITILDRDDEGRLALDLRDILEIVGPPAEVSVWEISGVEALGGEDAVELHRLSDGRERVPGRHLISAAQGVTQIIDGEFAAFRDAESRPWLIVRAVDSSAYDVETDDDGVLRRIERRFRNVTPIPS